MKKTLLFSLGLLVIQHIFGQDVSLTYQENSECGLLQSVDFRLDTSQLVGDTVDYWTFYSKKYTANEQVKFSLHCGSNYVPGVEVYFTSGAYKWINLRKQFIKSCPNFFSPVIGFLDSASQKADVHLRFNDSSLNTHVLKKAFLSTTLFQDVGGQFVNLDIDSNTLFGRNGAFGNTQTLSLNPGKYKTNYTMDVEYDGSNCSISEETSFHIGHLTGVSIELEQYAPEYFSNDTLFTDTSLAIQGQPVIHDNTFYWDPKGLNFCETINWKENKGCKDTNVFFLSPDSNRARRRWIEDFPNYTKPAFAEEIHYDYNSDGIIDQKGSDFKQMARALSSWRRHKPLIDSSQVKPHHHPLPEAFAKGNDFNITVWSRDSIGQWVKSEQNIDLCANFYRRDSLRFNDTNNTIIIRKMRHEFLNVMIYKYNSTRSSKELVRFERMHPFGRYTVEFEYPLEEADYLIRTVSGNSRCDTGRSYTILLSTGIKPVDLSKSIEVFPTLSKNTVQIKTKQQVHLQNCTVVDLSGKVLLSQKLNSGYQHSVDVSSLANGTYILRIETEQGILNERITKM